MGRHAEGWRLRWKRGVAHVRFTHEGTRAEISTGETDPEAAGRKAAAIYSAAVAGRLIVRRQVGAGEPLAVHVAEWLAAIESTLDEETVDCYRQFATQWLVRWTSLGEVTDQAVADLARERIRCVLQGTVRKELSALLGSFHGYLVEQRVLAEENIPRRPTWLRKTPGVRSGKQKSARVDVTATQMTRFLAALPEWGGREGNRWRARDAITVIWETGLRPKTVGRLTAPEHYRPGSPHLEITDPIDKARFGRRVPLTPAARAALDRSATVGVIFGRHDYRNMFARAAVAARMPAGFSIYDIRHARGQTLVDAGAPITGVSFLLGHKHVSTTNRYVRPAERVAAEALLWGQGRKGPRKTRNA